MKKISILFAFIILFLCLAQMHLLAQVIKPGTKNPADSLKLKYRFKDSYTTPFIAPTEFSLNPAENIKRTVEYDAKTNRYIIKETVGGQLYRQPQYLTFKEYQKIELERLKKEYWDGLVANAGAAGNRGLGASIKIRNKIFETVFGGNTISVTPRGSADLTFGGRVNRNENPLFNEKQRIQRNFDFDQRIQMNVAGKIGERLKLNLNYSTEAQFDFENQIKLDFPGKKDDILQRLELGVVSFPLTTQLITGTQALFGVKTQLQFGRLGITSLFSQQRSQAKEITITNGSQQNEFRITSDAYEANKHFFLGQYFRNNYNKAMANLPIITSAVNITKIEVWVTNRNNTINDSRDILAFMDLGENSPYNTTLFQGGAGFSSFPSAFTDPNFPQLQSNNLLQRIPANARLTNNNEVDEFFQNNEGPDNYTKLTYARKLNEREFTLNPILGFISLNGALNNDEILAVAYRYTLNGIEYQVGEFSNDLPVDAATPRVLYTKLLKNQVIKTQLPIWDLMMKNIYSLNAFEISPQDFKLSITRVDNDKGVENPAINEGTLIDPVNPVNPLKRTKLSGKLWLQVTGLDRINQQRDAVPDGFFDFIPGVTIDPNNGRIIFPFIEPFGKDLRAKFRETADPSDPIARPSEIDLINKYVYQPLYDSTQALAQQLHPELNRYVIKGTYQSSASSEFQLNAINVPEGSVVVTSGTLKLVEGSDYTVDYNVGRVKILNTALLSSGQPIKIRLESNELFGVQQKSLFGTRLDYKISEKIRFGGTYLKLTEQPLTPKVNIGEESVANSIYGFDVNYSASSRFLTRMIDKLPFISTKAPSSVSFNGEFANFQPGHPRALNFAGNANGSSYIDDFEASRSIIDLKAASMWQISGTPQFFPEATLTNDLSYGFSRAKLAFFNIDPLFYNRTGSLTPENIRNSRTELSDPYVREVIETEVFPFRQNPAGTILSLPTFNVAYYPTLRGPYNFTGLGLNNNGTFNNPRTKWGGIYRRIDNNDFEALNIEFIEFWVLDPFIKKPNATGGDLYFNLGNLSEDILRDGRRGLENGLPADSDPSRTDETVWGLVPKLQPIIQAFDNNPDARQRQDVGIDGIGNPVEQQKYATVLQPIVAQLNPGATAQLNADPSTDDYSYFRGPLLDQQSAGILKRYENFNGTEGNSKTALQSVSELGIENSASTALPDGEDLNRDNNFTRSDEYFQYKVSLRPQDMEVGRNHIVDKITTTVKLVDGTSKPSTWYQFRVPIAQFDDKVGNIQDFRSIRFMRMFMTDFVDTTVLRFARLQLIRGEWRRYNAERNISKVIKDLLATGSDNSVLDIGVVNIEENGSKTPIPYVVPPGILRERDFSNFRGESRQNEQSLLLKVKNLNDGFGKAVFKTTVNDFRSYKRLQMFIHAEGDQLRDADVSAFLRVGTDYQDNYYEYNVPLKVTQPGTRDPNLIWPAQNQMDIEFRFFQLAKTARNAAIANNTHSSVNEPYSYPIDGKNFIVIKGQPDFSKVRTIMLGVHNPLKNGINIDDGLEKTAEVWFNELRVTDFDQRGGWAATARMNAQLADFGDVTVSANQTSIGFGSLEQRVSETRRTEDKSIDIATSLELGKFFPDKAGVKLPVSVNYSNQVSTPQFDPKQPDIELKTVLSSLSNEQQREILDYSQNVAVRKSINFTNIRKIKTDPAAKSHLWDVENLNATLAYNEFNQKDFITQSNFQKNYRAALGYNYNSTAKFYSPLQKRIKSNMLALLRDFNFNLLPSVLNFRIELDRLYSENSLRNNNDPTNFIPVNTTFNKNFIINRLYGVSWDLSKSLKMDFNATNLGVVDEPEGRITGFKRDTLWQNLQNLGRTTDYNHSLNFSYTVPLNKIPYLNFINLITRYQTTFNWRSEPLLTLTDPNINFGNTIQNQRTIQINPTLNLVSLYDKFPFYKRLTVIDTTKKTTIAQSIFKVLLSLKNVGGTYSKNEGTFLPGYLPETKILGYNFDASSPGVGFLLGSQNDIRSKALINGWITNDTLQNQLYVNTMDSKLNLRGTLEPVTDLRIELTAFKNETKNYSTNFRFDNINNSFNNLSPITTGSYSVSFIALNTAFKDNNSDVVSAVFQDFLANREIISNRLGRDNPNSGTSSDEFADGYGKNSQDVLIPAFLAAYKGKDASKSSLNNFPNIPIPNWRLAYNGLTKVSIFKEIFTSIDITHGYTSTYNVNSFNTLIRYNEANGAASVRDLNNNFIPKFQISQVTIFEQFSPLIGVDVRMKNNVTTNLEFRKSRSLSFGITNSQLAQQNDEAIVFGLGYRTANFRFPFGILKGVVLKNDLNFKIDIALRDNKTVIYRSDTNEAEISTGSKNITYRPSIDYVINQRFNVRLFYDTNITQPYTSQTFITAFSNFGINLKFTIQ